MEASRKSLLVNFHLDQINRINELLGLAIKTGTEGSVQLYLDCLQLDLDSVKELLAEVV